jgi:hypothetical protein
MYISQETVKVYYTRTSNLGNSHTYYRQQTLLTFRCDNCNAIFTRLKSKITPKRLSNNYFHCCSNCNCKKFAQKKSIDRKTIWNKLASSLDSIGKY